MGSDYRRQQPVQGKLWFDQAVISLRFALTITPIPDAGGSQGVWSTGRVTLLDTLMAEDHQQVGPEADTTRS